MCTDSDHDELLELVLDSASLLEHGASLDPAKHEQVEEEQGAGVDEPRLASSSRIVDDDVAGLVRHVLRAVIVVVDIHAVLEDEHVLLEVEVGQGLRRVRDVLVGSQSDQVQHIQVVQGVARRTLVDADTESEVLTGVMSVDSPLLSSVLHIAFGVLLSEVVSLVVVVLNGEGDGWRSRNGSIHIPVDLGNVLGVPDVSTRGSDTRPDPVDHDHCAASEDVVVLGDHRSND